ncbi:MAG: class I SAM-dependent methyltransferase [Flavobacterium sp.]|nr:class I SAM-dependent methyltransferase [Flavobacterium sp.]
MIRNQRFSRIITSLMVLFFDKKWKCLDYAGGYGLFTRIMRDIGFDFYWDDPYTENLTAKGFERVEGVKYDAVTTFESFEHFEDPLTEVKKILQYSNTIIFSTQLIPELTPKPEQWWYYGLEHGQHIALYSKKSFDVMAGKLGMTYYNIDNLHILTTHKMGAMAPLLNFKYAKHLLYAASYLLMPFLRSKTMDDMYALRSRGNRS